MKNLLALGLALFALFCMEPTSSLHAQQFTTSKIVGFDPSNTNLCPTSGYTTVTGVYNTNVIQSGYCRVPVSWSNGVPFPSSLYAITCTPEAGWGHNLGYLINPQVDYTTRTTTGFTLVVNFYVNNLEISNDGHVPPGAIDLGHPTQGEEEWYVFGRTLDNVRRSPIGISEFGNMAVACIGANT